MFKTLRLSLLLALAALAPARAETVAFTESLRIEDTRLPVPMTLTMEATSATDLDLVLRGDLGRVQENLPALLSRVIEDECDSRTAIAVTRVVAEKRRIRLSGQLQARRYLCLGGNSDTRAELLKQTAEVEVILRGGLEGRCLRMNVHRAHIRPDGVTGALMNATGLTERLSRDLQESLDRTLAGDENCFDLPDELQAFDTEITDGWFTDRGDGRLGAVIRGRMTVTAENLIGLVTLLGAKGRLGD